MKDRGRIKWAPFLIPQHKQRIAQLYVAEDDVKQPELDEQMLDTLQETISLALEYNREISITYHSNKRNCMVMGLVRKVDLNTQIIKIESVAGKESFNIPLQSIINIQIKN
ncbi:YolD-like family protein [Paenibacillus sp. 2TAB26]|uniref:YolD-like family protein n=1 Tax=Paenibacillus sp. 2TAB26 TaxID=3233005 RepID=UPI003F99AC0F